MQYAIKNLANNEDKDNDDTEIKFKGIEALNKTLGPTAALRFLTLFHRGTEKGDGCSRSLIQSMTRRGE